MNFFKHRLAANIGITLVGAITALSMAGVAMQMGYSNFKIKAEKQLHILNAVRFATIVQIGLEEGWVDRPEENNSQTVTLSDIDDNYQLSSTLKNPSQSHQQYAIESAIVIENLSGQLKFYCSLIEQDTGHEYTNGQISIYDLTVEHIVINI